MKKEMTSSPYDKHRAVVDRERGACEGLDGNSERDFDHVLLHHLHTRALKLKKVDKNGLIGL